jgi:hypothetical protein
MGAQNVWNCIVSYNNDAAKKIEKLYDYDLQAILEVLGDYPDKDKYHGHQSGESGEGEHAGASEARECAINYLRANAPSEPTEAEKPKPKLVDQAKKTANQKGMQSLLGVVRDAEETYSLSPTELKGKLDAIDINWEDVRGMAREFARYKEARDERRRSKKK